MTHEQARQQIDALREQIEYHNKKYYTEDAPEISDYAYDMLYRRLENLEAAFPELKTEDSPTNRVGAAGYNTFAEVTHMPFADRLFPVPNISAIFLPTIP